MRKVIKVFTDKGYLPGET